MPPPNQSPTLSGSFRLFQVLGISVFVHWSWFVVAMIEFQVRSESYTTPIWNVVEYVSLFVIVLMHEFGHALACRQVGGQADEIVLWPLGGIAYVNPPPRPGAVLWSIAAGPLVNVVLVPITVGFYFLASAQGLFDGNPDIEHFVQSVAGINLVLLLFNMLPIYPLDGGQILQSLLWFVIGRSKSLLIVSVIGMVATAGIILYAVLKLEFWIGIIAAFAAYRCWVGFQQARILAQLENAPRHRDAACPSCDAHPLQGRYWRCDECGTMFDTFVTEAQCPHCGEHYESTACVECGKAHPIWAWYSQSPRTRHRDDDLDMPDTNISR